MSTNALTAKYNLPLPTIEKKWRGLVKLGTVAVPSGLALWLLAPILQGMVIGGLWLGALALLGGTAFVLGSLAITLKPIMEKQFAIWAYQLSSWQTKNYPMVRIGIYYEFLRQKYQRTKDIRAKIGGKRTQVADEIQRNMDTINDAARALQDPKARLGAEAIEEIEDRVLHAQQSKAALEKFLKRIDLALETIALLEEVNRKKFRQFKQILRRMSLMKDLSDLTTELNDDLRDLLGEGVEKADAEAAMMQIESELGQAFGQLEVLEQQSRHLIAQTDVDDEIALAQARQAMLESMRTIDGDTRVVSVEPATTPARSRLLDR